MSTDNSKRWATGQTIIQTGTGNVVGTGNRVGTNHGNVSQIGPGGSLVVLQGSGTVTINGKSFAGSKVEQRNGRVLVDDRDVTDEIAEENQAFHVTITGNAERIEGCHEVVVKGNAGKVKSQAGTIEIQGDVTGNVESLSGSIQCGKVAGNVKTLSGSIRTK